MATDVDEVECGHQRVACGPVLVCVCVCQFTTHWSLSAISCVDYEKVLLSLLRCLQRLREPASGLIVAIRSIISRTVEGLMHTIVSV